MSSKKLICTDQSNYGATSTAQADEEKEPLRGKMRQTVGISQATLVTDGTKAAQFPQYLAAIIVTIGGLSMGTVLGWTSPTEIPLKAGEYGFPITEDQFPWIGSLMSIGAIFGAAFTGSIADKIGRRTTIIALIVPSILGWVLMIWAVNPYMMMIGRIILGLASGAYSVVCPMYTNEISETSIRGTLGAYFQLQVTIGILFSYIIGAVVKVFWLSIICAIIPIILSVLMIFMPETAYYLLMKNDRMGARDSLQKLRGKTYNIDGEIDSFQNTIERLSETSWLPSTGLNMIVKQLDYGIGWFLLKKTEAHPYIVVTYLSYLFSFNIQGSLCAFLGLHRPLRSLPPEVAAEKLSFKEAFTTVAAKRGLAVGLGVMFFQQLSGINAVIFYTAQIFKSAGSTLDPAIATIVVGAVSVVATFVATLIVDRLGRKPLLFVSDLIMGLSSLVLGVFFYIQTQDAAKAASIGWLPITCMCIFIILFSLGYGPIPWMFIAEIFPPAIKGPASSIACLFNWVCAFLVTLLFPILKAACGSAATFWIFTVISLIGTVFVYFLVPETKGKSLDEVQRILGGVADSSSNATIEADGENKY